MRSFLATAALLVLLGLIAKAEETGKSSCSLCLDGSSSPHPDRVVFDAFFAVLPDGVKTCREVEEYLANDAGISEDSPECVDFQEGGAFACGCPAVPYDEESSSCSLCVGGAEPSPDLLDFVLLRGTRGNPALTCRTMHAVSSLPSQTGFFCDENRWIGYKFCGCPMPPSSDPPLCDASAVCDIPESKWDDVAIARPLEGVKDGDWTCGDVQVFSRMTTSGAGCGLLAAAANAGCGCPAPSREVGEKFVCPLCPNDDTLLPAASALPKKARDSSTCFNLLYEAAYEMGETCDATYLQDEAKDGCCNPVCKDNRREDDMFVALRDKGEVANCTGLLASVEDSFSSLVVYCDSQSKVQNACRESCGTCQKRDCRNADDNVTFPKMTVGFFSNFCRRLGRKKARRIARICKDNPRVRSKCSKTCNPDFCGSE